MTSAEGRKQSRGGLAGSLPVLLLAVAACTSEPSPNSTGSGSSGEPNVLAVSVSGEGCPAFGYLNEPCVSVTVCTPGTSSCQVVPGLLLDTGSTGLRIFRSALSKASPMAITVGSATLAECVNFLDGSSDWGPVETADVVLGTEPAVRVPIHVLDSTFGPPPSSCPDPESGPAVPGFNGVLGVAAFAQDCGSDCSGGGYLYYTCQGGSCTSLPAPSLSQQVTNPVALLPKDNNGVVVELPSVAPSGVASLEGSLILGIGTRANNTVSGVAVYPLDPETGEFVTQGAGITVQGGFADTGSNGLFFSAPAGSGLADCPSPNQDWFCPTQTVTLTPTILGNGGTPQAAVAFQIENFDTLTSGSANVFPDVGGSETVAEGFDWGLPFFFGRSVYIGIEGTSSNLGSGPYVAF